jgi:hypothetical protein
VTPCACRASSAEAANYTEHKRGIYNANPHFHRWQHAAVPKSDFGI